MNREDVQNGDWLKVGLSLDPVRMVALVEEHHIPTDAKGSFYHAHAYPMYHYYRFPGGFAINHGERHWMMLAQADPGGARIVIHDLDYDASKCESRDCQADCTCGEWGGEDYEECDYCAGEHSCEACERGEEWCFFHDLRHPRLN